ncbi:flagellar protein FliB [Clostridium tertium]|uniref:Flagellar biosynthetic protein FliU n=1 Tax=Clostridium tertium TaxID=1559 RepID=A0A6N2YP05_9CLOT
MKIRKPDYFDKFKCIADKCEDTCCAGWGIVIDDKSYEKYQAVEGEFGDYLRSKIVIDEGDNVFVLNGDRCSFLNDNNLCEIYSNIGGDGLCYTCRQYPRYLEEFGSLREIGLSLSCPEACRIILGSSSKMNFILEESDEEVSSYNDINPNLYINLMQCRKVVFDFLEDTSLDLNIRCSIVLKFIDDVQEKIDRNDINLIKSVKDKYTDKEVINSIINELKDFMGKENKKYNNIRDFFDVFISLKHIKPNDILGLENAVRYFWQSEGDKDIYVDIHNKFNEYYKEKTYEFEQILLYFVYRYFMKAVFNYDVLAKIKLAIVSYLMIKELAAVRYLENKEFTFEDMVDIAHTYSKDIEHLEENVESLEELFETNKAFSISNLIITLLN